MSFDDDIAKGSLHAEFEGRGWVQWACDPVPIVHLHSKLQMQNIPLAPMQGHTHSFACVGVLVGSGNP